MNNRYFCVEGDSCCDTVIFHLKEDISFLSLFFFFQLMFWCHFFTHQSVDFLYPDWQDLFPPRDDVIVTNHISRKLEKCQLLTILKCQVLVSFFLFFNKTKYPLLLLP